VVTVQDYPPADAENPFLLGQYSGVERPRRDSASRDDPDVIVIYKRAHEIAARDRAALEEEVRRTVVHEIAHHFGIDHEHMGEYR
jgi:predicted Zn-dependent protease with MMP-like domain